MKRAIMVILLALIISACGETTATATMTPTEVVPTRVAPLPTATQTLSPPPQSTAPPTPTLSALPSQTPSPLKNLGPIAYVAYDDEVHNEAIWLVDPLTQQRQRVYGNTTSNSSLLYALSWSPDGLFLAFGKSFGGPIDIFILDVANQNAWNITNTVEVSETQPAWSPDGKRIAFVIRSKVDETHYFSNIYVMDADGSNPRQLTDCTTFCAQPSWSPSGKSIVYMSDFQIFVIDSDGSNTHQITRGGVNETPDGQHIAFIRAVETLTEGYLYLMNPDGTSLLALTDSSQKVFSELTWSPDGRFIAFRNNPTNKSMGIYIIDIQTGAIRMATGYPAFAPAWYPLFATSTNPSNINQRPDCTNGWTRLVAGAQAQVTGNPTDPPNRVRSEPVKAENTIGQIYPGTIVKILEGPVCADGLVYWKVESATIPGDIGWTAEGDGKEYWLEPYQP